MLLVLAGRAGELTIGRHHIHPEPEAVFPMVVQRFGYRQRGKHRYQHPTNAHPRARTLTHTHTLDKRDTGQRRGQLQDAICDRAKCVLLFI